MALYKYVKIDVLKHIINGSIRFTQPGAFNDPFEMLPEIYIPESFGSGNINISFDILSPRRAPEPRQKKNDFDSDSCSDVNSRKILASLNQSIGVLCLSNNPASLLMWSHYADQYAGAVVEFDDEHEFFQGKIKVKYSNYRHIKDIRDYVGGKRPALPILSN